MPQRFLELCDEKGMYILDEVPYCWIGDQVKDPKYAPFLLQRAQETLARDKNRPCVLAWSLGNENPNGHRLAAGDRPGQARPTRPARRSSPGRTRTASRASPGRTTTTPARTRSTVTPETRSWGTNITEHPHTFYEKEVQDYDPGASDLWSETLIKTWDKLWKAPNILGSFIWEWQNQGIADKNADTTTDFWYGPDHLRQENNKGIVTAYRVPKPEWWIVKSAYSPVVVTAPHGQPGGRDLHGPDHEPLLVHGPERTDLPLDRAERRRQAAERRPARRLRADAVRDGVVPGPGRHDGAAAGVPPPGRHFGHRVQPRRGRASPARRARGAGVGRRSDRAGRPGHALGQQCPPADRVRQAHRDHSVLARQRPGRAAGRPDAQSGRRRRPAANGGCTAPNSRRSRPSAQVTATPGADGAMHVAVTSTVLAAAGGSTLGTLVTHL